MGSGISSGEAITSISNQAQLGDVKVDFMNDSLSLNQSSDADHQELPITETVSSDQGTADLHRVLGDAINVLHERLKNGEREVSGAEMEDLVLLSRELSNFMEVVKKRSPCTIQGIWRNLEKSKSLEAFGNRLYEHLVQRNPYMRVYFFGVPLKEQPRTILRMLGTAVYMYDKPEQAADIFVKSGARHRSYGVCSENFKDMETAFFKILPDFVDAETLESCREELEKFWHLLLEKLDQGNQGPEGERYAAVYKATKLKELQSDFALVIERSKKCDARHQFVGIMYAKAMEMYGDLSNFDALKDLRAASRVFQSYVDIVGILGDKTRADEFMLELGARHVAYNVTVENLVSFTEPFLYACRYFLEKEWNVAMESRFLEAFRYMVDGITIGMINGMNSMENKRAPSTNAQFCIMFTDIEASTNLWQKNSRAMGTAVKQHHRLIRSLIAEYGAYEVKTVGDSFIIAAKEMIVGVKIALAIQLELMRMAPIAPGFEMMETTEGGGDSEFWDSRTLRVRIGIEYCTEATATYDTIHRRYDYYGPSINRCARIEAAACGGQILLSRESYDALKAEPAFHNEKCEGFFRSMAIPSPSKKLDDRGVDAFISVTDLGPATLKGIGEPVDLLSMVPICLSGRKFTDKINHPAVAAH